MPTNIPLSQRFKQSAVRRVLEEAASKDMSYNSFIERVSTLGLNNDPTIQDYANILKEKEQVSAQQKRKSDIQDISQEAAQGRPYEMQPNQFKRSYETPPMPDPEEYPSAVEGAESGTGNLVLSSRMPTLEMQPTGIAKQGYAPAETYEQAYSRTGQIANEMGVDRPTTEEFKQYYAGPTQEEVASQKINKREIDLKEKKHEDLLRTKDKIRSKGYSENQTDEIIKKMNYIKDDIYKISNDISKSERSKREALKLKNIIENKNNYSADDLVMFKHADIDPNALTQNKDYYLTELDKQIRDSDLNIKVLNKELEGLNRSYIEIQENPNLGLPQAIKAGRENVRYGEGFGPPPALGGEPQIKSTRSTATQDTETKIARAKAIINVLSKKSSLTPKEQADLEVFKRFVLENEQQEPDSEKKIPPKTLKNTIMGDITLPGSRDERYVRRTR